eukprot:6460711-Prymnesium_polylepis.1
MLRCWGRGHIQATAAVTRTSRRTPALHRLPQPPSSRSLHLRSLDAHPRAARSLARDVTRIHHAVGHARARAPSQGGRRTERGAGDQQPRLALERCGGCTNPKAPAGRGDVGCVAAAPAYTTSARLQPLALCSSSVHKTLRRNSDAPTSDRLQVSRRSGECGRSRTAAARSARRCTRPMVSLRAAVPNSRRRKCPPGRVVSPPIRKPVRTRR